MNRYFSHTTQALVQQRRDQLLQTSAADIRSAPLVRAVMNDNCLCVMGGEGKIKEAAALFDNLVSLPD